MYIVNMDFCNYICGSGGGVTSQSLCDFEEIHFIKSILSDMINNSVLCYPLFIHACTEL